MIMRYFAILVFFLLALAPIALAQTQTNGAGNNQVQTNGAGNTGTTLINPLNLGDCSSNGTCLEALLASILNFVVRIGAIVVILTLVYIGFMYVTTARSNPGKISEIHQMLLWTLIGALILLGAQAIAIGIQATVEAIAVP